MHMISLSNLATMLSRERSSVLGAWFAWYVENWKL